MRMCRTPFRNLRVSDGLGDGSAQASKQNRLWIDAFFGKGKGKGKRERLVQPSKDGEIRM